MSNFDKYIFFIRLPLRIEVSRHSFKEFKLYSFSTGRTKLLRRRINVVCPVGCVLSYKGGTIQYPGGGVAGVFVADKLFISTGLSGALKISHFITCLYRTVLEVKYIFHAKSARNYLFKKNSSFPPWKSNGCPLMVCSMLPPAMTTFPSLTWRWWLLLCELRGVRGTRLELPALVYFLLPWQYEESSLWVLVLPEIILVDKKEVIP